MRCSNCTQGLAENFSHLPNKKCNVCDQTIYQCPNCADIHTDKCDLHTQRNHICLSKCLNECILKQSEQKSNKRKTKCAKIFA